jgi:hypothetical protein
MCRHVPSKLCSPPSAPLITITCLLACPPSCLPAFLRSNDIIVAWQPLPGTTAVLTKEQPLNEHNLVSMELTAGTGKGLQQAVGR